MRKNLSNLKLLTIRIYNKYFRRSRSNNTNSKNNVADHCERRWKRKCKQFPTCNPKHIRHTDYDSLLACTVAIHSSKNCAMLIQAERNAGEVLWTQPMQIFGRLENVKWLVIFIGVIKLLVSQGLLLRPYLTKMNNMQK